MWIPDISGHRSALVSTVINMQSTTKKDAIVKLVLEAWIDENSMYTATEVASVLDTTPEYVHEVVNDYNETAPIKVALSRAVHSYFEDPDEAAIFNGEGLEDYHGPVIEEREPSTFAMVTKQLLVSAAVFAVCCVFSYFVFG